ncbi:MAG: two-component sensor histidine kinase [Clostridia bacterium]|nr:two-component sensor histidine kinase [Clostridia bacterium]
MLKTKNNLPRTVSLRAKMVLYFGIFVVLVLAVLWLFQTVLLDDIYMLLKQHELDKCADSVSNSLTFGYDKEKLDTVATDAAKEYGICITVYEIVEEGGRKLASVATERHINSFCYIHNVRGDSLMNRLYREAKENDGEYEEHFSIASIFSGDKNTDGGRSVVRGEIVNAGDVELLLVFNSELMPLASTVDTLGAQLTIISGVLIIIAVIVALIFSASLSRPIRKMSTEASKLALGNYNVNFDGGNCTETVNLSVTLNRAAYELSKLDKMQKDLIANVSHDLRTPLTMISGYTEAMRDLPGEATPENMQIVIDETRRLTSLVNDMMEVSKYQGGAQYLNVSRFNFTEIIRTTLERYAKLKERDGYKITFDSCEDVFVNADETRILQVLYNLINNAVNYTGEDKSILIRQTLLSEEDGKHVLLEVIDTGRGIPEEELPLVWERYYKVHDFHKRADMGTGLGLSIVKNILLLHGAQFGVNSKVGVGSCFWFKLKVAAPSKNDVQ